MKTRLVALSFCITMAAMLAYAQADNDGFQMARVASIEKLAADTKHPTDEDRYKISMRLADTIYACKASAPAADFMDWTSGKEFPAKLDGKVLLVKTSNGDTVHMEIVGKKTQK